MERPISVRSHTARKTHKCCVCGSDIRPEQEYIRVTTLDTDKKIRVYKIHKNDHS